MLLDVDHALHADCTVATCLAQSLQDLFRVRLDSDLRCTEPACTWTTQLPSATTLDIQLAMGSVDLTELLRAYEEEEFLQDDNAYPCPACAGLVQKRLRICPMGSAVMMHLKRFGFNLKGRKLHDHVSFPQVLPLHGQRFDFAGVVTHAGDTLATGHYAASVDTGCLYRCDDHVVTRCDWLHVASEQAYLLV